MTWGQLKRKDWLTDYAKQTFKAYTDDLCDFNISAFAQPTALAELGFGGHGVRQVCEVRPMEDRGDDMAEERSHRRRCMVRRESEPSSDAIAGQVQGMAGQHGGRGKHLLHTQTLHRLAASAVRTAVGAAFGLRAGLRAENMVDRTAQTPMDGRRDKQGAGRSGVGGDHRGGGERRRR